jgi:quinol---cytochrome c reductase cytochrome b subunit, bacillus type
MSAQPGDARMWTARLRRRAVDTLPPEKLLPDRQPAYVASWIYVFGVATLAALLIVLASGGVLALRGPQWYHVSTTGRFVNSLHLWSVELFFFAMVIHLWGKFFMAAWRGNRTLTWITGGVAFVTSIGAAFTGYLSQQNFASQWIASEGKDGLNSVGIGAFFNVLNFGQMFMWHILLLPIGLGALILLHVLLVRKHGVVPPYPARDQSEFDAGPGATASPPGDGGGS